jgi:hypothetical protein
VIDGKAMVRAAACGLLVLSGAPLAEAGGSLGAKEGWAAMTSCARIAESGARRDCMEAVLRRAGLLPQTEAAAPPAPTPGPAPQAGVAPAERPAVAAAAPSASFGLPAPERPDERLEATLTDAEVGGDGRLRLTTSEGAVWREVESDPILPAPKAGQAVTVQKASLGGFVCKVGRWISFRCLRER